jgi:uncharacterized protein YecA (UPF0149 family)
LNGALLATMLAAKAALPRGMKPAHKLTPEDVQAAREAVSVHTGTVRWRGPKPGRNDVCPCGSGLKFKRCHGKKRDGPDRDIESRSA